MVAAAIALLLVPPFGCAVRADASGDKYVTGLTLAHKEGRFVIIGAFPGSPAERSGLQAGDEVLEIDGAPTITMTFQDAMRRLSGGTRLPVNVTVERDSRRIGFVVEKELSSKILAREGLRVEKGSLVPESEKPKLAKGSAVPTLAGLDLYSGESIRLESFRGNQTLLFFWASWCSACDGGIEILADGRAHGQGTLLTIGISVDESVDDAKEFLQRQRFGDYQVHDGGWFGAWSRTFHVYRNGIPWSVLVGPDGKIQSQGRLADVLVSISVDG